MFYYSCLYLYYLCSISHFVELINSTDKGLPKSCKYFSVIIALYFSIITGKSINALHFSNALLVWKRNMENRSQLAFFHPLYGHNTITITATITFYSTNTIDMSNTTGKSKLKKSIYYLFLFLNANTRFLKLNIGLLAKTGFYWLLMMRQRYEKVSRAS